MKCSLVEPGSTEVGLVPALQDLCSLSLEMVVKSCLVWLDQVSYLTLDWVLLHSFGSSTVCWYFLYTYTPNKSDALVQTCACVAYNQKKKTPCVRIVK